MAFAHAGCRWVTATARSTTPTLTNNRIPVNPSTNDPRTAIPFGRKTNAMTRKCGQRRMRQAVTREGTGYREAHASVTPYTCETEIPFGPQMSGGSDNAMSSARASVFDMAWWPNGMEVR